MSDPVFITQKNLAARWQVSTETVKRMRRANKLAVYYLGRSARYAMADVLRVEEEARAAI